MVLGSEEWSTPWVVQEGGGGIGRSLGHVFSATIKYFNDEARKVTDGLVPRIFVTALGVLKVCPKPRQKPGPGEAWGRG